MAEPTSPFERAVAVMARLRAPDGCPWDRKQTFDSIRPYTLEETYEVLEAIAERDWTGLREELGDLLLQVLFYAQMAREQGLFGIDDVVEGLTAKLIRRHPHVFEDAAGARMNADEALGRWDAMKALEKQANGRPAAAEAETTLGAVPKGLPALTEAWTIGRRAAKTGFDWPAAEPVLEKLEEEIAELRAELPTAAVPSPTERDARVEDEVGDLLFTVVNIARKLEVEPEMALKAANRKFRRRFAALEAVVAERGEKIGELDEATLERLWQQVKRQARKAGSERAGQGSEGQR